MNRIEYRRFVVWTYLPCWVLKARIQKHRGKPLLFHDKCTGFFYVHYTTHGTYSTALRPIRLWLSVLLKDTSAATGQAGIRTHILTSPELESNALDRSATTLTYENSPYKKSLMWSWLPIIWNKNCVRSTLIPEKKQHKMYVFSVNIVNAFPYVVFDLDSALAETFQRSVVSCISWLKRSTY